ncbi:MAG: SDR family oxidoreductase [Lachnospiraceae bacterium]|nr:SDR family oxidoreductase [Lachnospiraceae bacterium]
MKKALFVTGGTVGTGLAIAMKFAKNRYDVFLTSRNGARAKEAAEKVSLETGAFAAGFELDIRDEERVKEIFSEIDKTGRIVETVVLNSADMGFGSDPSKGLDFFTQDTADFQRVFETNLVWNFMIIRQAAIRMKEVKKGAIVFISSNTAYRSIPNRLAYSASKGGILAMSRALAVDLGRYGIRSNAVLPGTIKTERWVSMGNKQIVNGEMTPIGDISDFEDIANAAFFLGTDESKNVTGAELTVDGGMSSQLYPEVLAFYKKEHLNRLENDRP